ncbi:MAG: ABC transporter substrate-binding protein [Acidimicrobiales bacterium]|jgi:ABC-type transport system substrate-binding protein
MTQEKLPIKSTPTEKEQGIIDRPTSRRTFMKGAFSGAGALALGAYTKGGLAAVPKRNTPQRLSNVASSAASAKRSGTLNFCLNGSPATIDPALANELDGNAVLFSIYDTLTKFNKTYTELVPNLATSWTTNATATEWVFNLRPNVKFTDGTPFNSTTVRDTILHYNAAGAEAYFGSIKTMDDSSPLVFKITFSEPAPDLALNLDFVKMMPSSLAAQKTVSTAIGTGAFQLTSWKPASQITVTANPNYWAKPEPYLDGINFPVVPAETSEVDGLLSKSLDVIELVDPHNLSLLLSSPSVRLSGATGWTEICLLYVCNESPTSDVRVRQAIAYGIDREAIVRDVLLGQGTVATCPIPSGCYGHTRPSTGYGYDPSKARKLLKEAGYPKGISLTMAGSSDLATEALAGEAMVGQLAEAGITCNFVNEDIGVLVSDVLSAHPKRQTYIIHYGWINGGPWHYDFGDSIAHTKYPIAHPGSQLMNLLHKCGTTPDGPARLSTLAATNNLWMEELPHLPLWFPYNNDAYLSQVQGYEIPIDGWHPVLDGVSLT